MGKISPENMYFLYEIPDNEIEKIRIVQRKCSKKSVSWAKAVSYAEKVVVRPDLRPDQSQYDATVRPHHLTLHVHATMCLSALTNANKCAVHRLLEHGSYK